MNETPDAIEPLIESLLKEIGEDPGRDGLVAHARRGSPRPFASSPRATIRTPRRS